MKLMMILISLYLLSLLSSIGVNFVDAPIMTSLFVIGIAAIAVLNRER